MRNRVIYMAIQTYHAERLETLPQHMFWSVSVHREYKRRDKDVNEAKTYMNVSPDSLLRVFAVQTNEIARAIERSRVCK